MRWQLASGSATKTIWEQAARWRESKGPPLIPAPPHRFVMTAPPPDRAVVYVFWDKGRAGSTILPVRIDKRNRAAIRKGCFTAFILKRGSYQLAVFPRPLSLDLAGGEVCFLEFRPDKSESCEGQTLFKCSESEAVVRLLRLTYCR